MCIIRSQDNIIHYFGLPFQNGREGKYECFTHLTFEKTPASHSETSQATHLKMEDFSVFGHSSWICLGSWASGILWRSSCVTHCKAVSSPGHHISAAAAGILFFQSSPLSCDVLHDP